MKRLRDIDGWKDKPVEWIREQNLDGETFLKTLDKELTKGMRTWNEIQVGAEREIFGFQEVEWSE